MDKCLKKGLGLNERHFHPERPPECSPVKRNAEFAVPQETTDSDHAGPKTTGIGTEQYFRIRSTGVARIQKETALTVVSHLTCVGSTRDEIKSILDTNASSGIENILALCGDPPQGQGPFEPVEGGFRYAFELVEFIRKHYPRMGIGVAGFPEGHPEPPNRLQEIDHLKAKVDAGADYICPQLFLTTMNFMTFASAVNWPAFGCLSLPVLRRLPR